MTNTMTNEQQSSEEDKTEKSENVLVFQLNAILEKFDEVEFIDDHFRCSRLIAEESNGKET